MIDSYFGDIPIELNFRIQNRNFIILKTNSDPPKLLHILFHSCDYSPKFRKSPEEDSLSAVHFFSVMRSILQKATSIG
jgi:hypothetical protein